MLQENLIRIYEKSFRDNRELPALSDYFKDEHFSYYEMAKEIAKLHLLFRKAGIRQGDKIALIGRNNPRWCITYMAAITFGAVIVGPNTPGDSASTTSGIPKFPTTG